MGFRMQDGRAGALLLCIVAVMSQVTGCAEAVRRGPGEATASGQPTSPRGKPVQLKLPNLTGGSYATTFTILCMEAQGPDGARMVDLMARGLRNVQGLDPGQVRIQTTGKVSRLLYGAYRGEARKQIDQFAPPDRARQDLALIRSMVSGQAQPFQLARIVEAPTPDPGPREWDLKNAPGQYTLQITYVFDKPGLPNHKDVAVEICKVLRGQGEEAWYLHGDRISVVTVGHFEESDVTKDAQGKPLGYGPSVLALQNKREDFKYNTECLSKVVRVMGDKRIAAPSVLIQIPRESSNEPSAPAVGLAPAKPDPSGHR